MGAPLVTTFFSAVAALRERLRELGSELAILEDDRPGRALSGLAARVGAGAVFYNLDYEPYAIARDEAAVADLRAAGIAAHGFLDHVVFGADVARPDGSAYRVFTPYRRRWLDRYRVAPLAPVASEAAVARRLLARAFVGETRPAPAPQDFGFAPGAYFPKASERIAHDLLERFFDDGGPVERYATERDVPSLAGTSHLSPQLRAGTLGIRDCFATAFARAAHASPAVRSNVDAWIGELIWREFYQAVLAVFPHVARGPFLPGAGKIVWRRSARDLEAWRSGRTGYPIVDAAIRQLHTYGWMHNRLRMLVASFLSKDLLIDWRLGERHFERWLSDADLAANNGGWQWAASTGTDAVPYFRIFNPVAQARRFDPDGAFVKSMLPELANVPAEFVHAPWTMPPLVEAASGLSLGRDYPAPIVDHAVARVRALAAYESALRSAPRKASR